MNPGLLFSGISTNTIALVAGVVLLVSVGLFGWHKGAESVRADWEAERSQAIAKAGEVKVAQAEVTTRVVTNYVDRIHHIQSPAKKIIQEIPVYVPSNACALPAGFRLLHDAAASGDDSKTAGSSDASPIAASDLAHTIVDNYTNCRQNAEQLIALQSWSEGVSNVDLSSTMCAGNGDCGSAE